MSIVERLTVVVLCVLIALLTVIACKKIYECGISFIQYEDSLLESYYSVS